MPDILIFYFFMPCDQYIKYLDQSAHFAFLIIHVKMIIKVHFYQSEYCLCQKSIEIHSDTNCQDVLSLYFNTFGRYMYLPENLRVLWIYLNFKIK